MHQSRPSLYTRKAMTYMRPGHWPNLWLALT